MAASSLKLRNVFRAVAWMIYGAKHIHRLDQVFANIEKGGFRIPAPGSYFWDYPGSRTRSFASTQPGTATRDAGLIAATKKLDHYEISTYGSLATYARTMDL